MQGCKRAWSTLAHLVFGKIKSPTYCAKAQEYTLAHCLLAPLKKFPSSDANPVHPPLAELCVPCVPSDTETEKQPPQSQFPQNHPRPLFAPRKPRVAGFCPRWGKRPLRPVRGRFGPHRGEFGRKKRKPPTLPVGGRFGGVKKEQVKGPGSPEASRAGSLRPAEPSVTGFFPGVNFPVFRGRFGGLGVMTGVRKAKFPGGKPFLRVSPPGSAKG